MSRAESKSIIKSIMVIEDDFTILSTLKEFLELEGYSVLTAENGIEALELLKNYGVPNLILLDMKMPVMNGWQFAAEFLKKHDHKAPIVIMTAAADVEQRAREIGASGWIGKPFILGDCLKTIKQFERPVEKELYHA